MMKLTKRLIDSMPCLTSGQVFVRESLKSGFGIRLTKCRKTFILEKRVHGRNRRITIGPYGVLTVEQARAKGVQLAAEIVSGGDPAEDRRVKRGELTFGDLSDLYIERHLPRKRCKRNDLSMIKNKLLEWKNRKLCAITRKEVAHLHIKIGNTAPYQANRLLALVRKMFNLARVWGLYGADNPAVGIEMFKEEQRERFILPYELPRLLAAIEQEDVYVQGAVLTKLLTGARKNEVLTMRWDDVDISRSIWTIADTKAGHGHTLPLPAPLVEMLSRLPRQFQNEFVFPGRNGRKHIVDLKRPWKRIQNRAGLEDVRIHDLRRTLGSWLAADGVSLPIIGKVLNHSQPSTTAIYARLHLDPLKRVLDENATKMLQLIPEGATPTTV